MAKMFYEHIYSGSGFSGESFDIAAGPANTDIIDTLLSVGDGALTDDAPHVLVSTGELGEARILDIKGLEKEATAKGGVDLKGRFFFLSIQNSDIATNNLTIKTTTSGGTINGESQYVITTTGDYLFHYIGSGKWRCGILPLPSEALATIKWVNFSASDWDAGTVKNTIKIIPSGTPSAGEVGPHNLTLKPSYVVYVINRDLPSSEAVDVEVQFPSSGTIVLKKGGGADFNGTAIIVGSLD